MAERLLAKTVRHAGQALVGVRREATTRMSCLALSCALSCLCVGKAAAHCGHVYLQHDVGDLCSSKPKSAGSWVCGIILDISCACIMVGSRAMKSCFRSASSNTLKKRYWTLAITVSMCSSALHHTCMSCTSCLAHAEAATVIYPSTIGGAVPACISPLQLAKGSCHGQNTIFRHGRHTLIHAYSTSD